MSVNSPFLPLDFTFRLDVNPSMALATSPGWLYWLMSLMGNFCLSLSKLVSNSWILLVSSGSLILFWRCCLMIHVKYFLGGVGSNWDNLIISLVAFWGSILE